MRQTPDIQRKPMKEAIASKIDRAVRAALRGNVRTSLALVLARTANDDRRIMLKIERVSTGTELCPDVSQTYLCD